MKEFCRHIDYLLQKHDCVIIPDFGGFVLHRDPAKFASDGSVLPPLVSVGFNPDLKYNDGLLAESYMNAYSISYDIASKRIGDVVQRLNTVLGLRQPVVIGKLGTLLVDENKKLAFIPSSDFSSYHPETFGLENINIKRLSDIEQTNKELRASNRKNYYQRFFLGIGATAAAIVIFFLTSTPIKNTHIDDIQKSGFFVDVLGISSYLKNNEAEVLETVNLDLVSGANDNPEVSENLMDENELATDRFYESGVFENTVSKEGKPLSSSDKTADSDVSKSSDIISSQSVKSQKKAAIPQYYIIIGSASTKNEAQRLLGKFQAQGFKSAAIVGSKERPRIYISVFSDKFEAERYLIQFRSKNPSLSDSWIYTKRS